MSYQKTTWKNNSAPYVSAENLNKMENGIYSAQEDADTAKSTSASNTTAISTLDGRITSLGQSVSNLVVALNGRITAVDAKADENAENIETNKETESNHFSYVYGEITTVKEDIQQLVEKGYINPQYTYVGGYIKYDTGTLTRNLTTTRKASDFVSVKSGYTVSVADGYQYRVAIYDADKVFVESNVQRFTDATYTFDVDGYTRVTICKDDDAEFIETEDLQNVVFIASGKIVEIEKDVDALEDDLDDLADDVSALQTKESATERSLEMLWKLNKGQTYDIEETTESGTSDAPSGAEYFTVDEVYGNSTQNGTPSPSYPSEIVDVTEEHFKVVGRNLVDTSVFEDRHSINGSGEYVPSSSTADITSSDTFFNLYGATSITISGVSGQSYLCFYNGTTFIDTRKPFTSTATLSVPSGATCFRIAIPIGSKSTLQIERGTTSTSYVPYETPQSRTMSYTLRGIGDYKDVMDVESGKITHKVANTVLTINSAWEKFNTAELVYLVKFEIGGYLNSNDWVGISNYYKGKKNSNSTYISKYDNGTFAFNYGSTNYRVMFRNDACATVEEFKNAIPNDGISIEYVLEEYTEESISADDIAFLRGLENLSADHTITVTDQNGNDISYLVEWIIKLSEVV